MLTHEYVWIDSDHQRSGSCQLDANPVESAVCHQDHLAVEILPYLTEASVARSELAGAGAKFTQDPPIDLLAGAAAEMQFGGHALRIIHGASG